MSVRLSRVCHKFQFFGQAMIIYSFLVQAVSKIAIFTAISAAALRTPVLNWESIRPGRLTLPNTIL